MRMPEFEIQERLEHKEYQRNSRDESQNRVREVRK